jgi:hypothetical protein
VATFVTTIDTRDSGFRQLETIARLPEAVSRVGSRPPRRNAPSVKRLGQYAHEELLVVPGKGRPMSHRVTQRMCSAPQGPVRETLTAQRGQPRIDDRVYR